MLNETSSELTALEAISVESPRNISKQYINAERDRLFESKTAAILQIDDDDTFDSSGKRRVRSKPRCNLIPTKHYSVNIEIEAAFAQPFARNLWEEACRDPEGWPAGCYFTPRVIALPDNLIELREMIEGDEFKAAARNRLILNIYNVERPEKDYPEHAMYQREARNASPTRKKDAGVLNAFWEYRELSKSTEPLKSNYLQAENDNHIYADVDDDEQARTIPIRDAEAEIENRPGIEDLERIVDLTTVSYETRQVGLITGPKLSDCGYCMAPTSPLVREIKIPVSGEVECIGFPKDNFAQYEQAASKSMSAYWKRQATKPNHQWPSAKKLTKKQIGIFVDRIAKPEQLNISDLATTRPWSICQIGDLRIATCRTKQHYRGAITHYRSNGRWFPAKEDKYGTPYGSASVVSDPKYWAPMKPRTTQIYVDNRSPEAKARRRAKQMADKGKQICCAPPTEEMLQAFRLKLKANGLTASDNRAPYDGLPYNVKSADELHYGYAFGYTYASHQVGNEPDEDDLVERSDTLAAVNARISPTARRVVSMIVKTEETGTLAGSYLDVGTALAIGNDNMPSDRTLMRHGKQAVEATAAEIIASIQELAA